MTGQILIIDRGQCPIPSDNEMGQGHSINLTCDKGTALSCPSIMSFKLLQYELSHFSDVKV